MTSIDRRAATLAPVRFDALPAQVAAGRPLDVLFAVGPAHPSNQLLIERRIDGRPASAIRAWPDGRLTDAGQGFCARLPALGADERAHYTPRLMRSGQVVATLPARTALAVSPAPVFAQAAGAPVLPVPADPLLTQPRYEWASEFLGVFNVQLAKPPESFGPAPDGLHVTFYIASGEIHGPRINARIRGEGGDWMIVRRDGVGVADVRITYETDDGALLLSRYYGIFDLGPGGYERALVNQYDPVPPLVLAPQFVTSHPNWLWLNRLQCLAVGRVTMADLFVRFDLYAIRAGQPLASSGLPRLPDEPLAGDVHPPAPA